MKIIKAQAVGEIVEKKSRFIATIIPIETKEEAEQFIAATKKKYWDAKHNCNAYVLGKSNEIMHSSDDGEPSGTAGRPMMSVLTGWEVHNAAVVVTRYFGGVLLGTGGLVRAYQAAVTEALNQAEIIEQIETHDINLEIAYTEVGAVQHYLEQNEMYRIIESDYSDKVRLLVEVPLDKVDEVISKITQLTNGKAKIEK